MEETLTQIMPPTNGALPDMVVLTKADRGVRFTPRELRTVKERYDKSLTQLIDDDTSDDKLIVLAWLKLRREGHMLDLDDMDDVIVALEDTPSADPTSEQPSETSPGSAGSGG